MESVNKYDVVPVMDIADDYNPTNLSWNPRGVTGMDNAPLMKQMFLDMEFWIEEVIGKNQIDKQQVDAYKGTPKKWQILDDDCFDRDQIEKM
mmetsp:Transcript_13204/g.22400  ORF Transcript_13204/g.22400 Transcript_13204/m.22400 type:complete len:92 (+) Transcript_13204:482-757(+)